MLNGREQDYRDVAGDDVGLDVGAKFFAAYSREHDVRDDDIHFFFLQEIQGLLGRDKPEDVVRATQVLGKGVEQRDVVLHQKDGVLVLGSGHCKGMLQFATTMVGQPLAWMEATGLPDGYSFPGFVSYTPNKVFVLLFRENTAAADVAFFLPRESLEGKQFVPLAGEGLLVDFEGVRLNTRFDQPFQFLFGFFE